MAQGLADIGIQVFGGNVVRNPDEENPHRPALEVFPGVALLLVHKVLGPSAVEIGLVFRVLDSVVLESQSFTHWRYDVGVEPVEFQAFFGHGIF